MLSIWQMLLKRQPGAVSKVLRRYCWLRSGDLPHLCTEHLHSTHCCDNKDYPTSRQTWRWIFPLHTRKSSKSDVRTMRYHRQDMRNLCFRPSDCHGIYCYSKIAIKIPKTTIPSKCFLVLCSVSWVKINASVLIGRNAIERIYDAPDTVTVSPNEHWDVMETSCQKKYSASPKVAYSTGVKSLRIGQHAVPDHSKTTVDRLVNVDSNTFW